MGARTFDSSRPTLYVETSGPETLLSLLHALFAIFPRYLSVKHSSRIGSYMIPLVAVVFHP